jgi:hypothetical protein
MKTKTIEQKDTKKQTEEEQLKRFEKILEEVEAECLYNLKF